MALVGHANIIRDLKKLADSGALSHGYIFSGPARVGKKLFARCFANFLETVTRTSCANAGLEQSASIGRAAYLATAIFVVAGIFEILDIASEIVIWAFILVFGAVCLALALAFGLGGREVAGRFLEKWLEQKKND